MYENRCCEVAEISERNPADVVRNQGIKRRNLPYAEVTQIGRSTGG